MNGEQQDVVVGVEPQQPCSEQGGQAQVKGRQRFSVGFQLCLPKQERLASAAPGLRSRRQILEGEERPVTGILGNAGNRPLAAPIESSVKRVVPSYNFGQAPFECGHI
jgi:hypothetical protein